VQSNLPRGISEKAYLLACLKMSMRDMSNYWEEKVERARKNLKKAVREAAKVLESTFRPPICISGEFVRPLIDVYESLDELILLVEMPGAEKEDIIVDASEDALEIRARLKQREMRKGERILIKERTHGGFYRKVRLPVKVKPREARAKYTDGLLEVRLPKSEKEIRYKITIE
jgi:HSP20 family protein